MRRLAKDGLGVALAVATILTISCSPAKKPVTEAAAQPKTAEQPPAPEAKPEPVVAAPAPTPAPKPPAPDYTSPEALLNALIAKLKAGDLPGFFSLAGPAISPEAKQELTALFASGKFKLSASKPPVEATASGDSRSYSVFLESPAELAAAGEQRLQLALSGDATKGWSFVGVQVPSVKAIEAAQMAAVEAAKPKEKGPVDFAREFLDAVVAHDFRAAKLKIDPSKLTDEKLAALFIVVEEGAFKPHDRNPLIGTAAGTDSAWVIARLKSDTQESDFGIEMKHSGEGADAAWKVVGLNFSKLIQMAAAEAGAGNIAYTPIKTDLQDGDQLVLYFDYDNATVNPRAAKQLRIIADILREDPKKMIHINGHTDALGTVDYNQSLSDNRAAAVRGILLANGIPAAQIVTKAYGFSAPKAPNVNPDGTDNPTGRAQNRRAEVYLAF